MRKILLGEEKSKKSINEDNFINVELSSNGHVLPVDSVTQTLDSYKEYLSEKDDSDVYRLIFTINPVCTNILFNTITECVFKEGSSECTASVTKNTSGGFGIAFGTQSDAAAVQYGMYKGLISRPHDYIVQNGVLLKDTAFSHPEIGPVTYHCGIDIFNNHMLRKRNFKVVNKLKSASQSFNTIRDYLRDANGDVIQEKIVKIEGNTLSNRVTSLHLYQADEVKTFQESVHDNLGESEGWVGFINPVTMSIPNYVTGNTAVTINKCINDRKAGEFIDMYPDRSLYSFIPKYNKYRNRLEYNWDCFITYPYQNDEDNELVNGGIRCFFNDATELEGSYLADVNGKTNILVSFKTELKNNFYSGSFVRFIFINGASKIESDLVKVEGIGVNGEDTQHVFRVNFDTIIGNLINIGVSSLQNLNSVEIRVKKNVKGIDCKYYLRKFRCLPNFKNTDVYISDNISESDIVANAKNGFTKSVNQLAFAQNIYSDKVAQIVFNDDVVTTGIRDNLGRKLSEVYLTIVKRNKGHEKWYDSVNPTSNDEDIEFSHCFGTVSSGFDLPSDSGYTKYNIHRLTADNRSNNALENDITDEFDTFYGDIIEFSPYTLEETVLEDVYHRFNTEQRETKSSIYSALTYDVFENDDYDVSGTFTVSEKKLFPELKININDEGYYYKPHYKVKLRSFDENVKQGAHTKILFKNEFISGATTTFSGETKTPYGLKEGNTLYLINPTTTEQVNATIDSASGPFNMEITFSTNIAIDITKFVVYKPNILKPDYAYELNDGTGRYVWREVLPENKIMYGDELYNSMFTNGAHYFHQNINFYLKRQDPSGEYGLNKINTGVNTDVFTGAARGEFKDISMAEVQPEGENDIC